MPDVLLPAPASETFGFVSGTIVRAKGDSTGDADRTPDYLPNGGKVIFDPVVLVSKLTSPKMLVTRERVVCNIDSATGQLVDEAGHVGAVKLWTGEWKVSFTLAKGTIAGFNFTLTAASTEAEPLDLAAAQPDTPPPGASVTTILVPTPIPGQVLTATVGGVAWADWSVESNAAAASAAEALVSESSAAALAGAAYDSAGTAGLLAGAAADSELIATAKAAEAAASAAEAAATIDTAIPKALVDAKGDLVAGSASDTVVRVPVGANGAILQADSAQASGLAWSPVLRLVGTGSPLGVVSAPVGSEFIDTAVTMGASKWYKETGTGNTGWVVSVGDTGTRTVTADLLNGWTGTALIRRTTTGGVSVRFYDLLGTSATSDLILVIPAAFRPPWAFCTGLMALGYSKSAANQRTILMDGSFTLTALRTEITIASAGTIGWQCVAAWPTTLPGV